MHHKNGPPIKKMTLYGSEQSDLVAKYYNDAFGLSGDAEIAWYIDKVQTLGGSFVVSLRF